MMVAKTEIKERGIIFSAEMVQALLDGRKTQTRRVMKPQPVLDDINNSDTREWQNEWHAKVGYCIPSEADEWGFYRSVAQRHDPQCCGCELLGVLPQRYWRCPYGKPGDRLWVRETWSEVKWSGLIGNPGPPISDVVYKAGPHPFNKDHPHGWHEKDRWKSSRYMPRRASRITLEVTDVRVERVQEITVKQCMMEGIKFEKYWDTPYADFATLWDRINDKRGYSWQSNPWVWVIQFERIEQ